MSTRESIAAREIQLLRTAPKSAGADPAYARLLAWPPVHKLVYLGGDIFAITLAHMLAVRIVELFLRIPMNALNPFEYHRYYIPFFVVVLSLFEGYKSPELRRPEQELERSCKAVVVSFLGLVLFNFVVFRSEVFSRYMLLFWFVLACVSLVAVRFALRAAHERLWKFGRFRRRAVLFGSEAGLSEYRQLLSIQRHHCYDVVGILMDPATSRSPFALIPDLPWLGPLHQWEDVLTSTEAEVLIVAYPPVADSDEWLGALLRRCKQLRVDVEVYSCVLATAHMNYEHDEFSGCFRFYAKPEWSAVLQRAMKRGIDVAIGLFG